MDKLGRVTKKWTKLYSVYLQNKNYVYNLKKLTLQYPIKGPGTSGIRHFKHNKIPPLRYWNPDVAFHEIRVYSVSPPKVTLEMTDGTTQSINITPEMKEEDIFKNVLSFTQKTL